MAITFLKSILVKLRNKLLNARNGRTGDQFAKSFKEDQQKEEAFDHKKRGFSSVSVEQISSMEHFTGRSCAPRKAAVSSLFSALLAVWQLT